jgi:hypothetical protein
MHCKPAASKVQEEIIKLLLKRGADPCIRGEGINREWSPIKVARYHGADSSIIDLLISEAKQKVGRDEDASKSKKAFKIKGFCDGCLFVSVLEFSYVLLLSSINIRSLIVSLWRISGPLTLLNTTVWTWCLLHLRDLSGF